jgi:hypothetical protein
MTGIALQCDECKTCIDHRAPSDNRHGGTFHWSELVAIRQYAASLGWTYTGKEDFCPRCMAQRLHPWHHISVNPAPGDGRSARATGANPYDANYRE